MPLLFLQQVRQQSLQNWPQSLLIWLLYIWGLHLIRVRKPIIFMGPLSAVGRSWKRVTHLHLFLYWMYSTTSVTIVTTRLLTKKLFIYRMPFYAFQQITKSFSFPQGLSATLFTWNYEFFNKISCPNPNVSITASIYILQDFFFHKKCARPSVSLYLCWWGAGLGLS